MKPEEKDNDNKENKDNKHDEEEVHVYGRIIKRKIYFDNESFFKDLEKNIKESHALKPTVTPEKQKFEEKIAQLKALQDKQKNNAEKQKDDKKRMADIIREKSGRSNGSNKTNSSEKNAGKQQQNTAGNQPQQPQPNTEELIKYCEGAIAFLDLVKTEIGNDIQNMNNILSSGTPRSYTHIVGFSVRPLPNERDNNNENKPENDKDNDKDNDEGKGKDNNNDKDKNEKDKNGKNNENAENVNNKTDEQSPNNEDEMQTSSTQEKNYAEPNNSALASNSAETSKQDMRNTLKNLRFSPTIKPKPVNKNQGQKQMFQSKGRSL
ncbi:MAG: hypothetical protein MR368_01630 [Azospirillum sp.]|nr:hypothetical protein [Azospirillum sp.]